MRVIIINDTAKRRKEEGRVGHFGCHLVMDTFEEQLDRVGIELVDTFAYRDKATWKFPKNVDLAIVNGEGTTHHDSGQPLLGAALDNFPSVLVNAVWQDNRHKLPMDKFLFKAVRESRSQAQLPGSVVVPDVIFASKQLNAFRRGEPIRDIGVTDTVLNGRCKRNGRISAIQLPEDFLRDITQYKRICTGRHHGVVACAVLGIPFSAYPSNTHKIPGMMEDMGVGEWYFEEEEVARENVPEVLADSVFEYVEKAKKDIEKMFEDLWKYK